MVARPGDVTLNMNFGEVAGVTGLEPATSGVTGQRSNQLSYTPNPALRAWSRRGYVLALRPAVNTLQRTM